MDVVARLPRAALGTIALDYCHAGRTVMVSEDPSEAPWIEGEVRAGDDDDDDENVLRCGTAFEPSVRPLVPTGSTRQ